MRDSLDKSAHSDAEAQRMRGQVRADGLHLAGKKSRFSFYLILVYLLLEYGRPQVYLPFLSTLHLPAITIILLALSLFVSDKMMLIQKQTILFLTLLGIMVIHGPFAVNNYWALMIFITMSMNFIALLSLVQFVDNPEKYDRLVKIWLGIHIFLAVIGIVNKGTGIGGFLGDENDLCMTLNMVIPFPFFLSIYASGKEKIYYILLTCLFLFVIILTESRGGFVGLSATFIYCLIKTKRKAITALIVGLLAVFAVLVAPTTYWKEVRSITEEVPHGGSEEERIYTWRIGWNMFLDNPIIGVGQGNFPWEFQKYEHEVTGSDELFYGRSVAGRAAHSIYFTLLPELGLIGTFLFVLMVYYNIGNLNVVKKISRNHKNKNINKNRIPNPGDQVSRFYYIALALEGGMVSYLVSGAFISTLYYPNFWVLTGFILSIKNISTSKANNF